MDNFDKKLGKRKCDISILGFNTILLGEFIPRIINKFQFVPETLFSKDLFYLSAQTYDCK